MVFQNFIKPNEITPVIRGLGASVILQFAISAMFVALFGHLTSKRQTDIPWGYKFGLIFTMPALVTLLSTMVMLGLATTI